MAARQRMVTFRKAVKSFNLVSSEEEVLLEILQRASSHVQLLSLHMTGEEARPV